MTIDEMMLMFYNFMFALTIVFWGLVFSQLIYQGCINLNYITGIFCFLATGMVYSFKKYLEAQKKP